MLSRILFRNRGAPLVLHSLSHNYQGTCIKLNFPTVIMLVKAIETIVLSSKLLPELIMHFIWINYNWDAQYNTSCVNSNTGVGVGVEMLQRSGDVYH